MKCVWAVGVILLFVWSCSGDNFGIAVGSRTPDDAAGAAGAADAQCCGGEGARDPFPQSSGGAGGSDDRGQAVGGEAGEGALEVLSTSPEDASSAIERDHPIEVRFSAKLDPTTITAESFSVRGPSGAVAGELHVSQDTATFTPTKHWALLGDYTVTLAAGVRSAEGADLKQPYEFHFESRDGAFQKAQRLTAMPTSNLQVVGGPAGHAAAVWSDGRSPASSMAILFDPRSAAWGEVALLQPDTSNDYGFASLDLNDSGQAFAIAGSQIGAWTRFDGSNWTTPSSAGVSETRSVALGDDGTAMTLWEDIVGNEWRVYAQGLSSRNQWLTRETLATSARVFTVRRFASGFLAFIGHEAEKAVYSLRYDAQRGWGPEQPLTPIDSSPNYCNFAVSEMTAIFTWWDADGNEKAALFDGDAWTHESLGPASGASHGSVGPRGHIASWVYSGGAYAALFDPKLGWDDPVKLGATSAEEVAPVSEVDAAGNALFAWIDGTHVSWRRRSHAAGAWSPAHAIDDQDPGSLYSTVNTTTGEVMLVWWNPLGLWASRFE